MEHLFHACSLSEPKSSDESSGPASEKFAGHAPRPRVKQGSPLRKFFLKGTRLYPHGSGAKVQLEGELPGRQGCHSARSFSF